MNFKVLALAVEQFLTFVYWISYCQKKRFCYKFIQVTSCKKLTPWLSYCKTNRVQFLCLTV